jgi:ribonucleoside-diphosphate reductase alpha chain
VSNCGEQFLPPFASCRLICINLYTYVDDPFTTKAKFNYERFKQDVEIMQRLADDMVDLELECVDRIINKIKNDPEPVEIKRIGLELWENIKQCAIKDRRTGCGLTALADCIAALGFKYDSDESINFCEKMQREFKLSAFKSSVDMAEELGSFPLYDKDIDIQSEFIEDLKEDDPSLYFRMTEFGRRNMTLLTIAPTGSVSCLTQTSSGLEPVFSLKYTRRKKGNPGDSNFRSDFIDQSGDHWMNFDVYHHGLRAWMDITGETDISKSPYHGSQASELDYIKRIVLQSKIQHHVDNSISVTTNLPSDISKEVVSAIYLKAWRSGCKGMTIYRDGCRTGVLITNNKEVKKENIQKTKAPTRPKKLECEIHHTTIKGASYLVVVGLLGDDPYEVFASLNGTLDKKHKKGFVTKTKRGVYTLVDEEENVLVESLTGQYNESEEAITRLVSTALRHGADISFIVHQLEKGHDSLASYSKAMARILKKYIPDGTEVKGEECPTCSAKLVRAEGCLTCKSCGYSKCN